MVPLLTTESLYKEHERLHFKLLHDWRTNSNCTYLYINTTHVKVTDPEVMNSLTLTLIRRVHAL